VIIPVHNAESTIEEAIRSGMVQCKPIDDEPLELRINVCCYDDGSTDKSWDVMEKLKAQFSETTEVSETTGNCSSSPHSQELRENQTKHNLFISRSRDGISRGAGYARNQAAKLTQDQERMDCEHKFVCLLDSDDIMHPNRVYHQVKKFLSIQSETERKITLLGCNFDRTPPDSTWHYAKWANELSQDRLYLEKFREITLLQPTWMMYRSCFESLGGYIEAPHPDSNDETFKTGTSSTSVLKLVHPIHDNKSTLRVAEDLRFFHAHLHAGGKLHLLRTEVPLLTYRHRVGQSQSSKTPRKLLMQLRVLALEKTVLRVDPLWLSNDGKFCVWGAGRDGKDFIKSLSPDLRDRVACIADVDEKKINLGFYCNRDIGVKIPIVHFSLLARDPRIRKQLHDSFQSGDNDRSLEAFAKINKGKETRPLHEGEPPAKKRKLSGLCTKQIKQQSVDLFQELPVVVCVAMYRTDGALEHNVSLIGRSEGKDLWHIC